MFTSCDGRYRTFENTSFLNLNILQNASTSNNIKIVPKKNMVSKTDTIINPNLNISIKYYSLEDALIPVLNKHGQKEYFREFESEINIYVHEQLTVKNIISKDDFKTFEESTFWKKAILQYVWLNPFETTKDNISINCSFLVPNSKAFKSYKIYFNREGKREIKLTASS
ncbi:MAG: hypothetical protein KC469_01930 [Flavobacteriaceae bacterium]|nr:hypothetical protein [Flavobacteriaceae bacterium]